MNPVRVKALALKEARQVARDPSSILIAFVLPGILLLLFGYGLNLDAERLKIGVALESSHPAARRLANAFFATPYFSPVMERDHRALLDRVTSGELRGLLIIPADFAERLERGQPSPVFVAADGGETNTANFVRSYAAGALENWRAAEALERGKKPAGGIRLETRFWYNPELKSHNSLVPGSLAVVLAIVGTLLTAMVVAREWERGTMEGVLATPATPAELLAGKVLPYFVLGMLSMLGSVLVAVFLFGVPFRGSVPALLVAGGTFLLCALGQGLLISTVAKNQFVASQGALISGFLPAFLLSGFIFEIASMPWPIRQFTRVVPARYLVANLQTLFLVGDVWAVLLPNALFLLAISAIFFAIILAKSPSRLDGAP